MMVALAQQVSALITSRAAPAGPSRARAPLVARATGPSRFPGAGMSFRNSAAAARRWSQAPKRRSVAPRAADDDWEKLFADLKPLAPELSAAQVEVLERALARGRRQVPITDVAKELELRRDDVLAWVKSNAHRVPELAKRYPPQPEKVATVRLRERPDFDRREGRGIRDVDYNDEREYDAQTAYLRNAPGAKHVPKGAPAYKGYVKTRLGATNVATLEKVYASDTHPSDDMVESVRRATKLPRSKIVAWFKTRREEDKMAKRRAVRERYGGEEEDGFYDERGGDGFYERRGRGGRGGGGGRRGGRGGGGGLREGGAGDAYGARQERGRRDSTGEWSGRRG